MTRILVVDDSPNMARLMCKFMQIEGYEAIAAHDGRRALEMASAQTPDVILLDVMMPGLNGIEVLHLLKANALLRDIPVILVTAAEEDDTLIAGLDAGAHDYVIKPFKAEILTARVRSAVRVKESHDSLRQAMERLHTEIGERKRMECELAQTHKLEAVGHLAAGIAHEINTPAQYVGDNTRFLRDVFADVNNLLSDLDRLLSAAKRGDIPAELIAEVDANVRNAEIDYIRQEAPKAIAQSLEGIDRVANIVRAMKEFAHPGNGTKQLVDLNRAIEQTLVVSRNEWKYVADVVTDFDPDLPPVSCLPGDFNQVILNLVVNAAQAIESAVGDGSRGRGRITVTTRRDGDWVDIRVEDSGAGIPENIQTKVFDHFFTTKGVGKGTGQGLSIVRNIVVKKHRGTIRFESEEGKGTVFILRLPIAEPAEPERACEPNPMEVGN